jgi:cell division protein FtsL
MSAPSAESPRRKSILESPWYWLYAFCTVALAALVLMTPKFAERQAQIERQAQGRERAAQQRAGKTPSTPMSTAAATIVTLRPLMLLLAAVLAAAWAVLWWRHFRRPAVSTAASNTIDHSTSTDMHLSAGAKS